MKRALPMFVAAMAGCGAATLSQQRSPEYQAREALDAPVIRAGNAMLSEDSIRLLLTTRIVVPDKAKLVVAALDHRSVPASAYSYRDSETEFLQQKREFLDGIDGPLRQTGRFEEIAHVPGLLMERQPSLLRLREAAALMQANLLLVYEIHTQLIYDSKLLYKDQVKTHGTIDVLVVDVKTGAVPYTDTFEAMHVEKQREGDADAFETRKRADHAVSLQVLGLAAGGVKEFLEGLPARGAGGAE